MLSLHSALLFAIFVLCAPVHGASEPAKKETRPAKLHTLLTPQHFSQSAQKHARRQQTVISGLLVARQSCGVGFGLCTTGYCCELDGHCCTEGGCCTSTEWCYSTFCCKLTQDGCDERGCCNIGENCCSGGGCCSSTQYCVEGGCCPNGKVCSGISECDTAGFVPCTNDDFCCPPGEICFRDSSDSPRCRDSSSPTTNTHVATTPKATTIVHQTTTTHPTTPTTTTTTSVHTEPTSALTAPTGVPSAPAGSQNVVIDVSTNTEITWVGEWVTGPSSCSGGMAMSVSGGEDSLFSDASMGYEFTGTAVFVSIASNNMEYAISVDDDDDTLYDGDADAPQPKNCTFGWQRTNLDAGSHFLFIDPLGSQINRRDIDGPWYFELQNFVITQPGPDPAASSGTIKPEPTPASDQGDQGSGGAYKSSVSWLFAAVMIFVATMLVSL